MRDLTYEEFIGWLEVAPFNCVRPQELTPTMTFYRAKYVEANNLPELNGFNTPDGLYPAVSCGCYPTEKDAMIGKPCGKKIFALSPHLLNKLEELKQGSSAQWRARVEGRWHSLLKRTYGESAIKQACLCCETSQPQINKEAILEALTGEIDRSPFRFYQYCEVTGVSYCSNCGASPFNCETVCERKLPDDLAELKAQGLLAWSPCCDQPTTKSGRLDASVHAAECNKMICDCGTKWCFNCRAILDPNNPYAHVCSTVEEETTTIANAAAAAAGRARGVTAVAGGWAFQGGHGRTIKRGIGLVEHRKKAVFNQLRETVTRIPPIGGEDGVDDDTKHGVEETKEEVMRTPEARNADGAQPNYWVRDGWDAPIPEPLPVRRQVAFGGQAPPNPHAAVLAPPRLQRQVQFGDQAAPDRFAGGMEPRRLFGVPAMVIDRGNAIDRNDPWPAANRPIGGRHAHRAPRAPRNIAEIMNDVPAWPAQNVAPEPPAVPDQDVQAGGAVAAAAPPDGAGVIGAPEPNAVAAAEPDRNIEFDAEIAAALAAAEDDFWDEGDDMEAAEDELWEDDDL